MQLHEHTPKNLSEVHSAWVLVWFRTTNTHGYVDQGCRGSLHSRQRKGLSRQSSDRGYSMVEMLIVVIILGILTAVVSAGLTNIVPLGRQEAALAKARTLNGARIAYSLTVPDAATQWAAAATDTAKVDLLITANLLNGTASNFLSSPGGYTLSLTGGLRANTVVTKSGTQLVYE